MAYHVALGLEGYAHSTMVSTVGFYTLRFPWRKLTILSRHLAQSVEPQTIYEPVMHAHFIHSHDPLTKYQLTC